MRRPLSVLLRRTLLGVTALALGFGLYWAAELLMISSGNRSLETAAAWLSPITIFGGAAAILTRRLWPRRPPARTTNMTSYAEIDPEIERWAKKRSPHPGIPLHPLLPLMGARLLRHALAPELARLQSMAPPKPDLHSVLEAAHLIEISTGIELHVTVERNESGEIKILRRSSLTDYGHNLTIDGGEYVDYWMFHADTGSTRYASFLDATLAFCEPYKADIEVLARKLGLGDGEA